MTATPTPTPEQLEAVLAAALNVLSARCQHMETVDEWLELARAVAIANGCKTADLLTERDLDHVREYEVEWDEGRDGFLGEGEG